jgi:chromosome partitioning protein
VGAAPEAPGAVDLLTGEATPEDVARGTKVDNLDLIPATKRMTSAEKLLEMEQFGKNEKLSEAFGNGSSDDWDYVFFDCPASFGRVTMNGLVAADELIVPIEASDMAVDGAADLMSMISDIRKYHNPDLSLAGILVCRVDHRTNHSETVIEALRDTFEDRVFETTITQNVAVQDSYRHELPTVLDDPRATASEEYRALAEEIQ